ncbi:hypothetical protein K8Z49_30410 [Actinomadura madurae]|uniref:Uncharacterized protein n=1 Tax=Actinomadura madurae TaxID=1993 RepID=A0A1I5VGX1_9ACTN|nr:hypothetical protein [Actinomadura madurae]SFQ06745.1 hypothetical protein SAMN04489713_121132 [Actinomadura madurae]
MNSERDHQPDGPEGARGSAPDPPAPAVPPPEAADDTSQASPSPESAPPPEPASPSRRSPVTDVTGEENAAERPGPQGDISPEQVRERLRRRAVFLRELAEARELRRRVTPHRSRRARIHAALRRRTFRLH